MNQNHEDIALYEQYLESNYDVIVENINIDNTVDIVIL